MNIDEARDYLKAVSKPEFHKYIETKLAGDFAVSIALKMSEMHSLSNKRFNMMPKCMMPDGAEPCEAYQRLYEEFTKLKYSHN